MGADIHAFIECRERDPDCRHSWQNFHEGELALGRPYRLFAALAGVRKDDGNFQELIPARGLPRDVATATFLACHFQIVDDDNPSLQDNVLNDWPHILRSKVKPEHRVVKQWQSEFVREPDLSFHHHSHLTLEEIHGCLAHAGLRLEETGVFFRAAIAAMEVLNESMETRLVFWFDDWTAEPLLAETGEEG